MSIKTDIARQIVYADLPESDLDDLFKLIIEQRNKKRGIAVKGTKKTISDKEKAFLDCCKDNRNYNENENADIRVCPHCGSIHTKKNGFYLSGRQKYKCKDCNKVFSDTNGTVVYHSKLSIDTWIKMIEYTLQGMSIRVIARNLNLNKDTVLYNRFRIASVIRQLEENRDDFPSMAEGDEYYIPLSFKDRKDKSFFIEVLGRMPYTHLSREKRYEYVEKGGYPLTLVDAIIENEEYRKNQLLTHVGYGDLQSQEKFSSAVNDMEQEKIFNVLRTLDDQQKKKMGISNQQVCVLTCVDPTKDMFAKAVCVGRIQPKHIEKELVPHFTKDTLLVTDSHSAYKTVANRHKIPLRQIPSGKHTSNGYHLGHVNGYHHNLSDFLYGYHGVSTKYLPNYLALFNWMEKNKTKTFKEQAYKIIDLLAMQANRIPLMKFKDIPINIDMKGLFRFPQIVA